MRTIRSIQIYFAMSLQDKPWWDEDVLNRDEVSLMLVYIFFASWRRPPSLLCLTSGGRSKTVSARSQSRRLASNSSHAI